MTALIVANTLLIEYVQAMIHMGNVPPIIRSGNMDGAMDHNYKIFEQYKSQIHYL